MFSVGVEIEFHHREGGVVRGRQVLQTAFPELRVLLGEGSVPEGSGRFDYWRVVHDGSLNRYTGGELVSPILSWDRECDVLRRVVRTFRDSGFTVDESCGLHVHVGVRHLPIEKVLQVFRTYYRFQDAIESLVARHRRDNRYARRIDRDLLEMMVRHFRDSQRLIHMSKYYALSSRPLTNYGTIEFRVKESTLDPDEVVGWVSLCVDLVKNASEFSEDVPGPIVRNYRSSSKASAFLRDISMRRFLTYSEIEREYGWSRSVAQSYLSEMRSRGFFIKAVGNVVQYDPPAGSFEDFLARSTTLTQSYVCLYRRKRDV